MSRILITGGQSMIGHALHTTLLSAQLYNPDYDYFDLVPHSECDLLDINQVRARFTAFQPDYVFHLATYSGNIQFNQKYPADTFYRTSQIALNVLNACAAFKVEKVVSILSSCSIADKGEKTLTENDLWDGLPNETIECHGLAKRMIHAYSRQLYRQYKLPAVCAIVNNSFGPYDSFSPEKTKVVGGMIKRFVEAKANNLEKVVCWGSGLPQRQFTYSYDVGKALVYLMGHYEDYLNPINVGLGHEVTIKELAEVVAEAVGYEGKIEWDTSKKDGQMRKALDDFPFNYMQQAERPLKPVPFKEAIKETVDWYLKNKDTWTK